MKLSIVSTSVSVFVTLILVSIIHYVKEILDAFTAPRRRYGKRSAGVADKTVVKAFAFLLLQLSGRAAIVVALVAINCYSSCSCSE